MEIAGRERAQAEDLLKEAINCFEKAAQHVDWQYKAEAHYHSSKAYFRLWKLRCDQADLEKAKREAELAAKTYYEAKFITWVDFLNNVAGDDPQSGSS